MIRTALSSVVVAGLIAGGWALAGESCHKDGAASGGCSGCQKMPLSAKATEALKANPAYARADELIKSWSEVPAKFAAMNQQDKTVLASAGQKLAEHPAGSIIKPSLEFVHASLRTVANIDRVAAEKCAAHCSKSDAPASTSGEKVEVKAVAAEAPKECPKMAAAKLRMEQSAGLVAQANHLIGVACMTAAHMGDKDAQVKTVSDEGCPHAKAAAMAAAATTRPAIVLVKGEVKEGGEKSCSATAAKAEGEIKCPKALAAKAEAMVGESGKILAQWQEAGAMLASMDEATRTNVETACAGMMSRCPAGRLMPETLSTARALLVDAARLNAGCQAEAAKNAKLQIPAEMKDLMQSRCLLISATINVLDRTCMMAKPAKQMVSAQ